MNKIFNVLRRLAANLGRPSAVDRLSTMSIREFADLPSYHPRADN